MVTFLITAIFILVALGIGIYFWQKPAPDNSVYVLPPKPDGQGLFEPEFSNAWENHQQLALSAQRQEELIEHAGSGDRTALDEARTIGDSAFYDRVLAALVEYSDSDPKLLSL